VKPYSIVRIPLMALIVSASAAGFAFHPSADASAAREQAASTPFIVSLVPRGGRGQAASRPLQVVEPKVPVSATGPAPSQVARGDAGAMPASSDEPSRMSWALPFALAGLIGFVWTRSRSAGA